MAGDSNVAIRWPELPQTINAKCVLLSPEGMMTPPSRLELSSSTPCFVSNQTHVASQTTTPLARTLGR